MFFISLPLDRPWQHGIKEFDKRLQIPGDEVSGPTGLDDQPKTLDRIQVRSVGRQIQRLENAPVQRRTSVLAGVVDDEDVIPHACEGDIGRSVVQERQEGCPVAVAELQGIELHRARADPAPQTFIRM